MFGIQVCHNELQIMFYILFHFTDLYGNGPFGLWKKFTEITRTLGSNMWAGKVCELTHKGSFIMMVLQRSHINYKKTW